MYNIYYLQKGATTLNCNVFAQIVSYLTETPIVDIIMIFLWSVFWGGIGMAFRDIPKHISEIIIATYNFILSLWGREQIKYPPYDSSSSDTKKVINDEEKNNTTKVITFLKNKNK